MEDGRNMTDIFRCQLGLKEEYYAQGATMEIGEEHSQNGECTFSAPWKRNAMKRHREYMAEPDRRVHEDI